MLSCTQKFYLKCHIASDQCCITFWRPNSIHHKMFHLHLVFYVKVAFYSVLTTDGQMNICQTWEKLCVITTPPPPAILILVSKIFGQCHFQKIIFLLIFSDLISLQNAFDKSWQFNGTAVNVCKIVNFLS